MNVFDRTDIQSSGRLYCDQEFRIFVDFSRDDRFLLISSGHGTYCCDRSLTGTDIVLFDQTIRILSDFFSLQETEAVCKLWFEITFQNNVVFQ